MSGSTSCCPPGTESLQKRSRCPIALSTCHGFPAKVFQVSLPAFHLARNSRESVPGSFSCRPPATVFLQKCSRCLFPLSTWHGIPAKAFQVAFPTVHLARYSRESVPGSFSCRPPATVFPQKRSRCLFLPSTWHGIPAKAFQVGDFFWRFRALCNVGAFQQDKLVVFSMKRVAVCTPAVREYMHLSENHDVQKKVQLQVSHI